MQIAYFSFSIFRFMYSIRFLFLIFCGTILISSCGEKPAEDKKDLPQADTTKPKMQLNLVRGKDFSIAVGPRLSLTNELVPDAVLQYQDPENELYIIVTEENKIEFQAISRNEKKYDESKTVLKNFAIIKTEFTRKSIALKSEPGHIEAPIGGLPSEIIAFSGKPQGMDNDIFHKVAFIDTGEKIYTVMVWTLDDYKPQNLSMMDQMLYSFRKEAPVLQE